ncbi:MAG: 2,4-dihydroxyhept-2-ene-1,7-dioic acid aldolase [Chloroflexi bacterium]|nr:2,4-dihydroxyhept-2-ene-1,7-dioic acid aldolase [Chloroflexota bacterium]
MRENAVKRLWQEDKPALGGWLSIGNTFSAEVMAAQDLDWLCLDMQHGVIGYDTAVPMLQTISATGVTPIVRVPWCEPAMIMKMLDAGAYGIIVPLVNDRAQAEAAAAACRYPPRGIRSHGPTRAAYYAGFDYLAHANDEVLCIPQIETVEAMENLDDILSVPGIDAAYIGPMDLTISMGITPEQDGEAEEYVQARKRIVESCHKHGVVPGVHSNPGVAVKRIEEGFRLIRITGDHSAMAQAVREDIRAVREPQG